MTRTKLIIVFFIIVLINNLYSQEINQDITIIWFHSHDSLLTKSSGNKIYQWHNILDTSIKASQENSIYQPLFVDSIPELNDQGAIYFNTNKLVLDNLFDIDSIKYATVLLKSYKTGTFSMFLSKGYTGDGSFTLARNQNQDQIRSYIDNSVMITNTFLDTSWIILSVKLNRDENKIDFFKNGILQYSGATTNDLRGANLLNWAIGSDAGTYSYPFKGYIADVVFMDTSASDSDRENTEIYLSNKYNPKINLGANITLNYGFADTIINAYKPWFNAYNWSTGDADSVINVSQPDYYAVTVTDIFGFISSDSVLVSYPIIDYPISNSDTTLCLGDTLVWNTGLGPQYSYEWSFSQVSSSILHISDPGEYFVKVTDSLGYFRYSDTITVSVDSFPVQNSLGPDRSVCQGEAVSLVEQSDDIISWEWNNGSNNQFIIIDTAGTYAIHALNSRGCQALDTVIFSLSGFAPNVLFEADTICFGDSTSFTNLCSIPEPDFIESYSWSFGDDSISSLVNPKHLYQSADTFVVSLQATANTGCCSLFSDSVVVKHSPSAGFETLFGETQCVGTNIQFVDTSQSDLPVSNYLWDFGDENSSFEQNPVHLFDIAGEFPVMLNITANNNCSDSATSIISINENLALPSQPILVHPINNYFISNPENIQFDWLDTENATFYTFEIATDSSFINIINKQDSLLNSTINFEVNSEGIYLWRIIAFNLCGDSTISDVFSLNFTNIANLPDINLWLGASNGAIHDVDSNLLYWQNIINPADSAFQATASKQPKWIDNDSVLNNQPVIRFDGTDDQLVNLNYHKFGAMYVIAKWNGDETVFPTYNGILARYSSGDFPYIFLGRLGTSILEPSGTPWGSTGIYINQKQNIDFHPLSKYKLIFGQSQNPASFNDLLIGVSLNNNRFWKGEIAEIIAFDTIPSDSIKNIINRYLQNKYTPPVNLGADITAYGFGPVQIDAYKPWFDSYSWSNGYSDSVITIFEFGTYTVTVNDIFGNISSDSLTISFPSPNQITDTTICLGDSIPWNTDLNSDYSFEWYGKSSSDSAIYITQAGEYAFVITDSNGCKFYSDTISVAIDSFPVQNSLGPDRSVCQGEAVSLVEQTNDIVLWSWNNGSNEQFVFVDTAGTYAVHVSNSRGCQAFDTVVFSLSGIAPSVLFEADTICFGDSTSFLNLSFIPEPDFIETYAWSFDDDSSSSIVSPKHLYQSADTFVVSLQATANTGCSSLYSDSVIVKYSPSAGFETLFGETQCVGTEIQFIDTSYSDLTISSYSWNFGDERFSSNQNPIHLFDNSGDYSVSLNIIADNNCSDSVFSIISINDNLPLPAEPELVYPNKDYFISSPGNILFKWSETENAPFYAFEIASDSAFTNIINKQDSLVNSSTNYEINTEGSYLWRVIAFNLCGESAISDIFSINFTNIAYLQGINLWLSASNGTVYDADSNLLYWQNIVDVSDSAFQATTTKQPRWIDRDSILNNQPVICFDGINDQLINLNYHKFGAMYVIAKWNGDETTFPDYNGILARYSSGDFPYIFLGRLGTSILDPSGTPWGSTGIYINQEQIIDFFPLSEYKLIYGQTQNPASFNDLLLGASINNNRFWKGEIAEIIAFDTIPSDSVKNIIYSYLQNKYTPPVNLGADISAYGFGPVEIDAYKPWLTEYVWVFNNDTLWTDSIITINQEGEYKVSVTDIFGFESSDSIQVIYPEIVSLSDTTICYGDTLTWNTKLKGPYSFEWNSLASDSASAFITNPGEYFVKVIDTLGYFKFSDTITVSVDSFPFYATLGPDTNLCVGNDLFLQEYADQAKAYLWQDGSTFPSYEIQEAGTYWVKVEDTLGCIKHDTITVGTNGIAPVSGFYYDQYCIYENIIFTDTSKTIDESDIISQKWFVNDQYITDQENLEFSFEQTGNQKIKLEITSSNECIDFIQKTIEIQPLPIIDFTPLQGCTFVPIDFKSKSEVAGSYIINNIWTFNDSIINVNNPNYIYNEPGNYDVKLISESAYGCVDSLTQVIEIKPGPKADFSVSPACFGEPVFFQNNTEVFLGFPVSYEWNFGDDSISTALNPIHNYDSAGEYIVELYAYQAANGCTDSASHKLRIFNNPVAEFENAEACHNEYFTLNETSYSVDEEVVKWVWNISNQTIIEEQNPTLYLQDTGVFSTQLIVFSESGCSDTTLGTVTIHELPVVDFSINPDEGIPPFTPEFTNSSLYADSFTWYFGDGETSNEISPIHTYTDSGSYVISLKGMTEFGCTDSISKTIKVIIPAYDIGILSVSASIVDNYLTASAQIVNYGSYLIDTIVLNLTGENGIRFRETWTGNLGSGEMMQYQFNTNVPMIENNLPSYICVEANITSKVDENSSNDENCFSFDDTYKIIDPYPNPSNDRVIVGFNLPYDENVTIFLYNSYGSKMQKVYDGKANKGYNRVIIDLSALDPGIYTYQIIIGDKVFTKRVMKSY